MTRQIRLVAFLMVAVLPSLASAAHGRYYMIVYGYQGVPNRAVSSHTFASFVDGDELERYGRGYQPPTISWLPATGVVRPIRTEPGRNFTLAETLGIARRSGFMVQQWGPYEITPELYGAALRQIAHLQSGAVWYKMINGPLAPSYAINCIHAVSDIAGPLNTGTQWGYSASASVVGHLSRWVVAYPRTYPEVMPDLGL